jgi:hypothetical protein
MKQTEIHEIEYLGCKFRAPGNTKQQGDQGDQGDDFETLMLLEPKNANIQYYLERNCIKFIDQKASEALKQEATNSLRYLCAKDSIKVTKGKAKDEPPWEASLEEFVECMGSDLKGQLVDSLKSSDFLTSIKKNIFVPTQLKENEKHLPADSMAVVVEHTRQEKQRECNENLMDEVRSELNKKQSNTTNGRENDKWWEAVMKNKKLEERLKNGDLDELLVRRLKAILGFVWEHSNTPITFKIKSKIPVVGKVQKNAPTSFEICIEPNTFVNDKEHNEAEDENTWRRKLYKVMTHNNDGSWVKNIKHLTWQDVNSVKDLVDWEEKYRWSNSRMCYNCCDCYASDDEITKTQKMASSHVNRCWRCTALCSPNILEDESGEDTDLVIRNTVWTQFMHDGQKLTTNWNKENVPAVAADSVV